MMSIAKKYGKVIVVFIRGLPGSGKTTLALNLVKRLKFTHIDPDNLGDTNIDFTKFCKLQNKLNIDFNSLPRVTKKYRYNLHLAQKALDSGTSFIWCQTWSNIDGLIYTFNKLSNMNSNIKLIPFLIELAINEHEAVIRVTEREGDSNRSTILVTTYSNLFEDFDVQPTWIYLKLDASNSIKAVYRAAYAHLRKFIENF